MRFLAPSARLKTQQLSACRSRRAFLESLEDRHLLAAEFVPGEILVAMDKYSARFQEDGKAAVAVAKPVFQSLGMHSPEVLFDLKAGANNSARLITKWSVGADVDLGQLAERLAQMSGVVYAEPNAIVTGAEGPTDASLTATLGSDWGTRFGLQGHLTGYNIAGTPNAHISAMQAWALPGMNFGAGVRVAVLDTGIDLDHPDLVGSLARNPDNSVLGINFVTPGASVEDDRNHGTGVTGLIAAALNNTDRALGTDDPSWNGGVAGIAPEVEIMPVKVLNANNGGTTSWTVQGIDWAVENQAQIINMSLGYTGFSQSLYDAVTRAYNAGVLVVVAAHNQNASAPIHPGSHPMVLGVGAVDRNDLGTYFTNFGSWVDVSAPGLRVLSTGIDTAASATDGYGRWFGTSFSSPIVAGVAALILAQNPTWTPTQVAAQLVGTADDIYHLPGNAGYNDQLGSGRVNAFRAVSETLGLPHVVSTSTNLDYSTLDQPMTVRFSQGMDPNIDLLANGQPANFEVRYDANSDSVFAASERIDISFFDIDGAGPMPAEYVLGPTVALKLGSTNPGQYQLIVRGGVDGVHDAFGQPLGDANGNAMAEHTATFTIATGSFVKIENASIPDRGTLTSSLEIGAAGTIYDVNVKLNLTHTVDEDLDVFLIAPDGMRVELFTDVGSVYDNFINTVLDDSAATAITSGTGPFTGTYRPEGSLATLNGKNLAGTWSLEVSDDTRKNTGELLDWSLMARTTSLRPEILVTPTSGLLTTESGGTGSFTVSLSQAPTADVVIPLNTMDYSEGQVSADSLTFTPANWSVPQTIVVTGQDDTLVDGTISYSVFTGLASSADPAFNGLNPANVSLTNLDNDVPPTKFYVVNDGPDRTHEYSATGTAIEDYALNSGNTAPRGAASTAAGDKVWVVDANRNVYVYNPSGALLGSWSAGTLPANAAVEGIATDGIDVWIVDAASDKVYRYTTAASRLSGSQTAASSFNLTSGNNGPKDIVTDGASLWVLNDASTDKVFKYTVAGALLGSWTITNASEPSPTGITLDPANPSHLWIVGSGIDRVYQYDSAVGRTSGSQGPSTSFTLAGTNTNPQGIADPPAPKSPTAAMKVHDQELMAIVAELDEHLGKRRMRS